MAQCIKCHQITIHQPFCAQCTQEQFRVQVHKSPIHGLGLFALHTIPAFSLIVPYNGYILSLHECMKHFPQGDDYLVFDTQYEVFINARLTNAIGIGGRANHSSTPNAQIEMVDFLEQQNQPFHAPFWIKAIRSIKAQTEIVIDYGDRYNWGS